jgi:tetratricopeptide (TPR) repeat protein
MESALVERGLGNFPKARALLHRVLRAQGASPAARQHAWWSLGGVERFSGHLPSAVGAFSRAAALARRLGDRSAEAFALCGAGGVARVIGRSAPSLAFYRRAYGLLDRLGDPFGRAYGLCGMANAHRTYGDARKTLPLYRRSAGLYKKLGDESSEGFAWWGLGGSFRRLDRLAESRRAYDKALALFRKSEDARGVAMALLGLGAWAEQAGRPTLATSFRRRALRESLRHDLPYESALARWALNPNTVAALGSFGVSPATVNRWKDIP